MSCFIKVQNPRRPESYLGRRGFASRMEEACDFGDESRAVAEAVRIKGFLSVQVEDGKLVLRDRQASIDTPGCLLREVFRDGELLVWEDFRTIRDRVAGAVPCS